MPKALIYGNVRYWPGCHGDVQHPLLAHELQVLLMGGDPEATGAAPPWRPIQPRPVEEVHALLRAIHESHVDVPKVVLRKLATS